jgi:hypothetical protein
VETPLTWPVSVAASHVHVCSSEWRVPSGQCWPSNLSTVIVQRSPVSCAAALHPAELVMCATHPPEGGHVELAVQVAGAPGAPLRFNEYVPLKSSAHAGLANPKARPVAAIIAVSPRLAVMVRFPLVASIFFGVWDFRSIMTATLRFRVRRFDLYEFLIMRSAESKASISATR